MKSKHKVLLAAIPLVVVGTHLGNEVAHHLLAERPLYATLVTTAITSITLMLVEKKKSSLKRAVWNSGAAARRERCRALRTGAKRLT